MIVLFLINIQKLYQLSTSLFECSSKAILVCNNNQQKPKLQKIQKEIVGLKNKIVRQYLHHFS